MIIRLFDHWKLSLEDRLEFLGLSSSKTLTLYRKGGPIANRPDLLERVGCLLAIHQSLRILFSYNREIAYEWMTTPNSKFQGRPPASIVREKGLVGLKEVRQYLEFERER
ncbi:MAG: MbcA/ParS/Xre antitoxin family protein [Actinomycetota bacterium]|nr:MbcA/ParS/Xre antitoxin family protein [Actinomycetota bacterium]